MPTNKINNQIQVRIDSKTKEKAQKTLESLGMDISTAVRIMLKQVINTGNLPYEIRDKNGFTLKGSEELRHSIAEAEASDKKFKSGKDLIKNALL